MPLVPNPMSHWDGLGLESSSPNPLGMSLASRFSRLLTRDSLESLGETTGVRLFRFCERLKPLGQLRQPFFPGGLCEPSIHLRIFVCFALDGGFQDFLSIADGNISNRVAHFLQDVVMTKGLPRFRLRGISETTTHGCV